jgi:hypothetical protein
VAGRKLKAGVRIATDHFPHSTNFLVTCRLIKREDNLVRRLLSDLAIGPQLPVENTQDIVALEKSNDHFFLPAANDDAEDGRMRKVTLQRVPANDYDPTVLEQDGELPHAVIASPEIEEIRDNLWADHLAPMKREISGAIRFVYIFANQQTCGRSVLQIRHGLTSTAAVAVRAFAHCTRTEPSRVPVPGRDNFERET